MVPHRRGRFEHASPERDLAIWGPPVVDSGDFVWFPWVLRGSPEGPQCCLLDSLNRRMLGRRGGRKGRK